jgi:putative endonuclease
MKEFYVYAIVSEVDGRIYVGIATNPLHRLTEHNRGKTFSTRAYIPWKLFYIELCRNAEHAREREKYFKTSSGKRRFKAILRNID